MAGQSAITSQDLAEKILSMILKPGMQSAYIHIPILEKVVEDIIVNEFE